jgi:hypothetical protein
LEEQVSILSSKITDLAEGDQYMTELLEKAGGQLKCKFCGAPKYFSTKGYIKMITSDAGTCLDGATEKLRIDARVAVLDRVSAGVDTFWSDARRHQAIVLLQDHADQIEGTVEFCQKALMTTLIVMLLRNPVPRIFADC